MDAGSTTNPRNIICSAFQDVVRQADELEHSLRKLSGNHYSYKRRGDSTRSSFEDLLRALERSHAEQEQIPKNSSSPEEYRSRQKLDLDWILSTDPLRPRAAKEVPVVEKPKGVPISEWIFDTKGAFRNYNEYQPITYPVLDSRPRLELDWILTTNQFSQPISTRNVEPYETSKAISEEWIFRTDPEFHSTSMHGEEMQSLEHFKNIFDYLEEEALIRTASAATDKKLDSSTSEIEILQ
ncbi:hypothetical protein RB195_016410 [Necator americanus]